MQYVYLIKSGEFFKIGIANDPGLRLAQLQTGNPNELEISSCYGFEDAAPVERVLHQKFKKSRHFLEWFKLSSNEVEEFEEVCRVLDGELAYEYLGQASNSQIEEADEVAGLPEGGKWDFAAMYAEGWRIELTHNGRGNYNFWQWRKSMSGTRKSIYGGRISDLPYTIDEMKRMYGG